MNRVYRIAFFMQDYHNWKYNHDAMNIRCNWQMLTYLKWKLRLHPAEIETVMRSLLEAGWVPKNQEN